MEEKISKPPEKVESYIISIKGGDKDRTIKLSSKMFRLSVANLSGQ